MRERSDRAEVRRLRALLRASAQAMAAALQEGMPPGPFAILSLQQREIEIALTPKRRRAARPRREGGET